MPPKKTTKAPKNGKAAAPAGDKKTALEAAIAIIERDCGKGTIMRLGENARMEVSAVPTGSLNLDIALGVGGVPRGRIVEIYGPESSGKTTVALHVVAEVQKMGGEAAFIDAEHALDPVYAKNLGVNINDLLISQPDSGEQALEIAERLVLSRAVDVIVIDSVAALVPQQEIDGNMGQSYVGVQARLMSQALRKLSGSVAKSNCVLIFINQLREKVGISYGNPEVTPGGRALKFYASVRIEVRKGEALKNSNGVYGSHTKAKVVKNKVAPPFRTAEFDILYGKGISKTNEIFDAGLNFGFVEKSGSFFSYDGNRWQGKDNARAAIESDPAMLAKLEEQVRAAMMQSGAPAGEEDDLSLEGEDEFDIRDFSVDDAE